MSLLLVLKLIRVNAINQQTNILLDNQAVIAALTLQRHTSSYYLIDQFHAELHALKALQQHENLEVEVTWVRGHDGNEGNEPADWEAKKAAQCKVSPSSHIPKYLQKSLPIVFQPSNRHTWPRQREEQ